MVTYKQIVYLILDELKLSSDDAYFNEEHILFMLDKYRSEVLSRKYNGNGGSINESNFQEICLELEENGQYQMSFCNCGHYLRSKKEVPWLLSISNPIVFSGNFYDNNICYVSKERMSHVGYNKYLNNFIYCSIGPDNHLYLKSANPQFLYLEKVYMKGIFENPEAADNLSCNENKEDDIMDRIYPIEDELIPDMIAAILRDLLGYVYNPQDKTNNADDNLPDEAHQTAQQQPRVNRARYYRKR